MVSIYGQTLDDLKSQFKENGLNESGASLVYNYLYKKGHESFTIANLARETIRFLEEHYEITIPEVSLESGEETKKFLIRFSDFEEVECVLIPFQGKHTLCLSSQVGCAMKCSFCYTGTQGLSRHLEAFEIVGQLMAVKKFLREKNLEKTISNIVFMGQGEPLHNFSAVRKACEIFLSQHGLSFGREKITISTAGYLPGLKEWSADPLKVNLALSFHCPDERIRSELIPLNKQYPLKEVLAEIKKLPLEKKRFITFEILLIKDLNDREEYAHQSAHLIKDMSPLINIIPFNPIPGSSYERPLDEMVERFREVTESYGIPSMVRKTKGDDILAACGQLKS